MDACEAREAKETFSQLCRISFSKRLQLYKKLVPHTGTFLTCAIIPYYLELRFSKTSSSLALFGNTA